MVTGSAHRIGAEIIKTLHQHQYRVIIHYKNSKQAATELCQKLNKIRHNSANCLYADLNNLDDIQTLAKQIKQLDLLVNNASVFYEKSVESSTIEDWNTLINQNTRSSFFTSQALLPQLTKSKGAIINIVDIHVKRPLKNHAIYNIAKAGVEMMTKTLAKDLAPDIRVNGVSPGSILWPQPTGQAMNQESRQNILACIPLNKQGTPIDIANAVYFLANADYITGHILVVDGGRTLNQ